jgi:hypothetical protein
LSLLFLLTAQNRFHKLEPEGGAAIFSPPSGVGPWVRDYDKLKGAGKT